MAFRDPTYTTAEEAQQKRDEFSKMFFDSMPENQRPDVANNTGYPSPFSVYARSDGKGYSVDLNKDLAAEYNTAPGGKHSNDMTNVRNLSTRLFEQSTIANSADQISNRLTQANDKGFLDISKLLQNSIARIRYA